MKVIWVGRMGEKFSPIAKADDTGENEKLWEKFINEVRGERNGKFFVSVTENETDASKMLDVRQLLEYKLLDVFWRIQYDQRPSAKYVGRSAPRSVRTQITGHQSR